MTNRLLRDLVLSQLFPGVLCPRLGATVDHLLGHVRIEHFSFGHGPIRQALVRVLSNPRMENDSSSYRPARATIRLHMREGAIYGMCITTETVDLHRTIELAGQWLATKTYDERAFEQHECALTRHLCVELGSSGRCDVTLERNSSLPLYPDVGEKMVCKFALSTLNSLLVEYGLAPIDTLPAALAAHFALQFSSQHDAVVTYIAQLDPAVLAFLEQSSERHAFPLDRLKIYQFLAGAHGVFRRNRLQAIYALPWLLGFLIEPPVPPDALFGPRACSGNDGPVGCIARAIDEATPLLEAVSRSLRVPRETVRWLGQRRLPPAWTLDVARVELLLRLLSWIAPEKRPRNEFEFEQMVEIGNALLAPFRFVGGTNSVEQLREPRYGLSVRRWYSELTHAGLAAAHADMEAGRLKRDIADVKDFLGALYQAVQLSCEHSNAGEGDNTIGHLHFVLDWTRTKSLRQILQLSRRWHDEITRMPAPNGADPVDARVAQSGTDSWPAVLPEPLRLDAFSIVELTETAGLAEEGHAMGHCVGGYGEECSMEGSVMFSVRDDAGRRLSTAQLLIDPVTMRVSAVQHRGARNDCPPRECEQAIDILVRFLNHPDRTEFLRRRHLHQRAQQYRYQHDRARAATHSENSRRLAVMVAWTLVAKTALPQNNVTLASLYMISGTKRLVTDGDEGGRRTIG